MSTDEQYAGWRRQFVVLDVLAYGPTDPADWDWRALIRHCAADVVDSEDCRMPWEEN